VVVLVLAAIAAADWAETARHGEVHNNNPSTIALNRSLATVEFGLQLFI
jgi:hypothetical protein